MIAWFKTSSMAVITCFMLHSGFVIISTKRGRTLSRLLHLIATSRLLNGILSCLASKSIALFHHQHWSLGMRACQLFHEEKHQSRNLSVKMLTDVFDGYSSLCPLNAAGPQPGCFLGVLIVPLSGTSAARRMCLGRILEDSHDIKTAACPLPDWKVAQMFLISFGGREVILRQICSESLRFTPMAQSRLSHRPFYHKGPSQWDGKKRGTLQPA